MRPASILATSRNVIDEAQDVLATAADDIQVLAMLLGEARFVARNLSAGLLKEC
jgi:hypothetical protein